MTTASRLYTMNLGEFARIGDTDVLRVPGGWIYFVLAPSSIVDDVPFIRPQAGVFVPYSPEFYDGAFYEPKTEKRTTITRPSRMNDDDQDQRSF